ncbi:hypothetical protein [Rossellomorea aquimaris]|uniref:hypothetical protein n=1 Tax=Rossellomorea aquimaris TaxID=189382 RepID=UPI003990A589
MIGVQDEDSCGKSELGETCPAPAARGSRHKPCHPKRQKAPFWLSCLMFIASEQTASAFLTRRSEMRRGGSPIARGKRSLARKSLAVLKTGTAIVRLYL